MGVGSLHSFHPSSYPFIGPALGFLFLGKDVGADFLQDAEGLRLVTASASEGEEPVAPGRMFDATQSHTPATGALK